MKINRFLVILNNIIIYKIFTLINSHVSDINISIALEKIKCLQKKILHVNNSKKTTLNNCKL